MYGIKEILIRALDLSEKEFSVLADYGYCDHFIPDQMTVQQWQSRMKEAMMEDEMAEMELGESIFRPGDKNIIINVLNRL